MHALQAFALLRESLCLRSLARPQTTPLLQNKDCQTAHWPAHKENCKANADTRSEMKAASAAGVTDPQAVERLLKHFSQTRRPIMTMAALEAFRLDIRPENIMKYILWVELEPTGKAYPHEFRLQKAEKWTLDDLREHYAVRRALLLRWLWC